MDLTVTFTLTERELRRAYRNMPQTRTAFACSASLVLLCLALGLVGPGQGPLFAGAAVGVALLLSLELLGRGAVRRSRPLLAGPVTGRYTDAGYTVTTSTGQETGGWDTFRTVRSRAGFWYLIGRKRGVMAFLPHHAVDADRRAEVEAFLAGRVSSGGRPVAEAS